jgi:hypothetical protein
MFDEGRVENIQQSLWYVMDTTKCIPSLYTSAKVIRLVKLRRRIEGVEIASGAGGLQSLFLALGSNTESNGGRFQRRAYQETERRGLV